MQVDKKGKGTRKCYECGDESHHGRDCPIRPNRIAAGGPAILLDNPNGKGMSKGCESKGICKSAQFWPTPNQWKSLHPGPAQSLWQSWRPQAPHAVGKGLNLFEVPHQLSALQQFFQMQHTSAPQQHGKGLQSLGVAYTIVPKAKAVRAKEVPDLKQVAVQNSYQVLSEECEDIIEKANDKIEVKTIHLIKAASNDKLKSKQKHLGARAGCFKEKAEQEDGMIWPRQNRGNI